MANRELEQALETQLHAAEESRERWRVLALALLVIILLVLLLQLFPHGGFGPDSHP